MVKFNAEDGHWVTIGGRRIFIQEGQSLPDAMKKSGKFTREQKKAGVQVKESDLDKNIKDMDEDELKAHLNKLESGMDDFDQDEPEFKQLQKEYNEAKKQLDSRSKNSDKIDTEYDKKIKDAKTSEEIDAADKWYKEKTGKDWNEEGKKVAEFTDEEKAKLRKEKLTNAEKEAYGMNDVDQAKADYEKALKEMRDADYEYSLTGGGTKENLKRYKTAKEEMEQAKANYEHAADKYEHYKFNGADDEDRIKYKKAKDEAYDNYVKKQRDYDENRLKPKSESYTQKDLDNAKAKMLEMEGTLDDASSDPEIRKSTAYKDIKNEYNQAKAEYDKISESLRNKVSDRNTKNQAVADRIMGKNNSDYSKMSNEEIKDEIYHNTGMLNEMERRLSSRYKLTDEQRDKLETRAAGYESTRDELKSELERRKNKSETYGNSSMFNFNKPEQQNLKTYSNELKYREYYKKENLGESSNYQKGDKIEFSDGYYSTLKGSIVREATDKEKKYQMNSNLKGYVVRDTNGNEHIVADTRIRNVGGTQAYKSAYEDYKKKHPNTKLSFGQFVDMSEGK